MHRFDVAGVGLGIDHAAAITRLRVIGHEFGLVLRAGKFEHIDGAFVRTPGDVGEIAVGGVTGLEIDGLVRGGVEHAHRHLMARHTRHRILLGSQLCHAMVDIDEGIVRDHRLVHAIEGQQIALRTPERSLGNAEFVTMDAQTILEFTRSVGRHLMVTSVSGEHKEVPILHVGQRLRCGIEFRMLRASHVGHAPHDLLLLPVVEETEVIRAEKHLRTVGIGEFRIQQVIDTTHFGGVNGCIEFVDGEEYFGLHLTSVFVGQTLHVVDIEFHQTVAPEGGAVVGGHDVGVVRSAPHQILKRKAFLALCHGCCAKQHSECCKDDGF